MSRALGMAKKVQESSTFEKSAQKISGTVDYLADTFGQYEGTTCFVVGCDIKQGGRIPGV